jgi:hypothetical protein
MRDQSHSSIKRFQRCPQQYYYNYVERIEPVDRPRYLDRGGELHAMLELLYQGHRVFTTEDWAAEDIDIIRRYVNEYGLDDEWEVVATEQELIVAIGPYKVKCIIDLIVRYQGKLWVIDHKTTANIPDEWDPYNMSDWQNGLYLLAVRQNYAPLREEVGGFIFNYLRTKKPTQPSLIKDGSRISDLRRIDTTPELLRAFAKTHDMLEWEDVQEKLYILENTNKWFARHVLPVNETALAQVGNDVYKVLVDMERKDSTKAMYDYPRHVVGSFAGSQACSKCSFQSICHADMFGLDREAILSLDYKEKE